MFSKSPSQFSCLFLVAFFWLHTRGFWKFHQTWRVTKYTLTKQTFAWRRMIIIPHIQTQRLLDDILIEILKEQCVVRDASPFPAPFLSPHWPGQIEPQIPL